MADVWQMVLNSGEYTFDLTTRWSLRTRAEFSDSGTLDFLETLIAVEGVLVGTGSSPATTVTTKFQALLDMIEKAAPIRVELKLNGTTKYDFQPGASIGSPRIREVVEIPEGSSHATHIRFQMAIFIKTPAAGSAQNQLTEFEATSEAEYYNNRLIRQTWTTRVRARTLALAKASANATKPSGVKPLIEIYQQNARTNEWISSWIWDKAKGEGIVTVVETVSLRSAGHPWGFESRVGKDIPPAWFQRRYRPGRLVVTLEVEATALDLIQRPTSHLKESATDRRDLTEPEESEVFFDAKRGLYRKVFVEVWNLDEPGRPELTHGDGHDQPFPERSLPPPRGGLTPR